MEESIYTQEEIIALEKENKRSIYLYTEEDCKHPLWFAFEASAYRLHELIPELEIYHETTATGNRIATIRNITSSTILALYENGISCPVYFQ